MYNNNIRVDVFARVCRTICLTDRPCGSRTHAFFFSSRFSFKPVAPTPIDPKSEFIHTRTIAYHTAAYPRGMKRFWEKKINPSARIPFPSRPQWATRDYSPTKKKKKNFGLREDRIESAAAPPPDGGRCSARTRRFFFFFSPF